MLINSPNISGSLTVTGNIVASGSLNVAGTISGTVAGTTSTASYVEYSNVASKPTLVSGSSQITYSGLSGIPSGIVSGSAQITGFGIFATTGSNQFNGNQAITGSLTTTGQIIAQTLNVQQVTSSIVYSSGSNIFGNSLANTQQFTGSVGVTGSLTVTTNGTELQVTNTGVNLGNALTDSHIISGSLRVNPSGLFVSGSGNVGINTTTPSERLSVVGAGLFGSHGAGSYSLAISNNDQSNVRLRITNAGSGGQAFSIVGGNPGASNAGLAIYDETNAATRLYITSGGNVGIGNTSAYTSRLTVQAAAGNRPAIKAGFGVVSGNGYWVLGDNYTLDESLTSYGIDYSSGDLVLGSIVAPSTTTSGAFISTQAQFGNPGSAIRIGNSGDIYFFRGTSSSVVSVGSSKSMTESMRITSGGNVGIGTASPFSGAELDVYGDLVLGQQNWAIRGNNSFADIGFEELSGGGFSDANYRVYLKSGGNVGIANTNPNKKLEITTGNGVSDGIRITYNNVTSEGLDITYLNTGATTTSFDSIYNSNSAVMQFRMKTAGTPVTALSILGSGAATFSNNVTVENSVYVRNGNGVYVNNTANTRTGYFITSAAGTELSSHNGAGEPLILIAPDTTATMRFYTGGATGANERMRITSSGIAIVGHTAGVGTNFSPPIQVKGGAGIGNGFGIISGNNEMVGGLQLNSSSTNSLNITADPDNLRASTEIGFNIDGTERMRITSGGNVGIGRSPLSKLAVYGGPVQIMQDYPGHQLIVRTAGTAGTYNGQLTITIPEMNGAGYSQGYGGYSCEVYVSGYSGIYCHAWFSGYINNGITVSETTIIRSNGGWSISQTAIGTFAQGFQFVLNYPDALIHPTARIIFNKGGDPNIAEYPANSITAVWS